MRSLTSILLLALATPAPALELAQCARLTTPSHGGEAEHRDLKDGRVFYVEWWSLEGVYRDIVVADCGTAQHLTARTVEERISDRPPYDRDAKAARLLETELGASAALFSLDRIARALDGAARDIKIAALDVEPCACAALYPGARDWASPFQLLEGG